MPLPAGDVPAGGYNVAHPMMHALLSLCLVVLSVAPARGQTAATITGTVSDASGGALPGVTLGLRNATGLSRAATSGVDGRFVFAGVPAGGYELRADLSGFRPLVRQGVAVSVAQTRRSPWSWKSAASSRRSPSRRRPP